MNPFSVDRFDKQSRWNQSTAGFSLVELLVTIAVMGIVAGMVFTQRAGFSESINLKNVTQEIAVAVRQAQVYGTTSRGSGIGDDIDDFTYSMEFTADSQEFLVYIDDTSRGQNSYQQAHDLLIEEYKLPSNMRIRYICLNNNFGDTTCNSNGFNSMILRFSRPHPDAQFLRRPRNQPAYTQDTLVLVIEETDSERQRKVVVQSSGYITVE